MPRNTCPHCNGGPVSCLNSRPSHVNGVFRWRIYECDNCKQRFKTEETVTRMEGDDDVITMRHRAAFFLEEVQALAEKHFGKATRVAQLGGRSSADED